MGALIERLLAPDRLAMLLQGLLDQDARRAVDASAHLAALQAEVDAVKTRLERLYRSIEDGIVELDDSLQQRILQVRAEYEKARSALDRARLQATPTIIVDADRIAQFGRVMRDRIDSADINSRRTYIASVVSAIEVHDERICIFGQTDILKRAVARQRLAVWIRGFWTSGALDWV